MTISSLPLSYCTNVHPGRTIDEVVDNLAAYSVPIRRACGGSMCVGMWFAKNVVGQVQRHEPWERMLRECLDKHDLEFYTINAFPFRNFHSDRVKDSVYEPDWSDQSRLEYTLGAAHILADHGIGVDMDGSISTLPLGFKGHTHDGTFIDRCIANLIEFASRCCRYGEMGTVIRLAIEPEPLCVIETTDEAIDFFHRLWEAADAQGPQVGMAVRNHIGLCYDVCHQAVEYEDAARSIIRLHKAGIRINKVQISNAIEVRNPTNNPEALAALRDYIDERYLHQTFGRLPDGTIIRVPDLTHEFLDDPGPDMLAADIWRVHYHVPVNQQTIGPLDTTRDDVVDALTTIKKLPYAPHLEVETYTWTVMPGEKPDIVAGLAAELKAVREIIDGLD